MLLKRFEYLTLGAKRIDALKQKAQKGDANDQFILAREIKRLCVNNCAPVVNWCTRAAMQGHVLAQCMLGFIYDKGSLTAKDEGQAIYWMRKGCCTGK